MLLLKSDERERWDTRCAELEWFEEIRFNFQRQKQELCCCSEVCVCVCVLGEGYGEQERCLNLSQYQRGVVRGWICAASQNETQPGKKIYNCVFFWIVIWSEIFIPLLGRDGRS